MQAAIDLSYCHVDDSSAHGTNFAIATSAVCSAKLDLVGASVASARRVDWGNVYDHKARMPYSINRG